MHTKCYLEYLKRRFRVRKLDVDERVKLRWILEKLDLYVWTAFGYIKIEFYDSIFERGDSSSGYLKAGNLMTS
jgi:hypothetical protein